MYENIYIVSHHDVDIWIIVEVERSVNWLKTLGNITEYNQSVLLKKKILICYLCHAFITSNRYQITKQKYI